MRLRDPSRSPLPICQEEVGEALKLVGLDGLRADRYGTELERRAAAARGACPRRRHLAAAVSAFDEPLSNLDAGLRDRMRFELVELQRRLGQTPSLYRRADQSGSDAGGDRIILMKDGRIMQSSTPRGTTSGRPAGWLPNSSVVPTSLKPKSFAPHRQSRRRWQLPPAA